jgi:hypothetical protein
MNKKSFGIFLFLLIAALMLIPQIAFAATYTYYAVNGTSDSTPGSIYLYAYGNWTNTTIQDGFCPHASTSNECWGTGAANVPTVSGNEFFQELHFNVSGFSGSLRNVTFCFSACWTGETNGCSSTDEPEFDINNGTALVQIYNSTGWENISTPINLGGEASSSAMTLTTYCKSTNAPLPVNYYVNGTAKIRVLTIGDYESTWSDCEMFTDYAYLQLKTASTGGGGGSSCIPIWQCDDWGKCDLSGDKHRDCYDLNECNIIDGIPALTAECEAWELCFNGIRDSKEQGIDCGGECEPCPIEETVAVEQQRPKFELPLPEPVCKPFEWPFWLLYLFVLIVSYITLYKYKDVAVRLRKDSLMKIMIFSNILLFILVLLDTVCSFRWYLVMLLIVIFFTIVYLDKIYIDFRKQRKGK